MTGYGAYAGQDVHSAQCRSGQNAMQLPAVHVQRPVSRAERPIADRSMPPEQGKGGDSAPGNIESPGCSRVVHPKTQQCQSTFKDPDIGTMITCAP